MAAHGDLHLPRRAAQLAVDLQRDLGGHVQRVLVGHDQLGRHHLGRHRLAQAEQLLDGVVLGLVLAGDHARSNKWKR